MGILRGEGARGFLAKAQSRKGDGARGFNTKSRRARRFFWGGVARVGDLTETRRHGGFACIGRPRHGRMARQGDRSCSCVRHVSLFVSVGANPTPEVVVHREAV